MFKSGYIRWTKHVRSRHKILTGKSERKIPLEGGGRRYTEKDNIKKVIKNLLQRMWIELKWLQIRSAEGLL